MKAYGKSLSTLLAGFLLAACSGGVSGTYEGGLGSITFDSGKADTTLMGSTIEMAYTSDADKIVLRSPQGEILLTRNQDGSIDTPWGTMKKKH